MCRLDRARVQVYALQHMQGVCVRERVYGLVVREQVSCLDVRPEARWPRRETARMERICLYPLRDIGLQPYHLHKTLWWWWRRREGGGDAGGGDGGCTGDGGLVVVCTGACACDSECVGARALLTSVCSRVRELRPLPVEITSLPSWAQNFVHTFVQYGAQANWICSVRSSVSSLCSAVRSLFSTELRRSGFARYAPLDPRALCSFAWFQSASYWSVSDQSAPYQGAPDFARCLPLTSNHSLLRLTGFACFLPLDREARALGD